MTNAKKLLTDMLNSISYVKNSSAWVWINALMMAVSEHAEVETHQAELIRQLCSQVCCGSRGRSDGRLTEDIFIIAAWINTAHLTNNAAGSNLFGGKP